MEQPLKFVFTIAYTLNNIADVTFVMDFLIITQKQLERKSCKKSSG